MVKVYLKLRACLINKTRGSSRAPQKAVFAQKVQELNSQQVTSERYEQSQTSTLT
jgi:hypothetical protein